MRRQSGGGEQEFRRERGSQLLRIGSPLVEHRDLPVFGRHPVAVGLRPMTATVTLPQFGEFFSRLDQTVGAVQGLRQY
jgi:hypothetical protein